MPVRRGRHSRSGKSSSQHSAPDAACPVVPAAGGYESRRCAGTGHAELRQCRSRCSGQGNRSLHRAHVCRRPPCQGLAESGFRETTEPCAGAFRINRCASFAGLCHCRSRRYFTSRSRGGRKISRWTSRFEQSAAERPRRSGDYSGISLASRIGGKCLAGDSAAGATQ